jgi:hypothetical protein
VDAVAFRDELVLAGPIMNKKCVGVASLAYRKSLTGPDGDDVNVNAGCGLIDWQNVAE